MKLIKSLCYLFFCVTPVLLFISCAKDGATGPAGTNGATGATGATGPISKGNLFGYVKKFDQYGSAITTGLSGVTVNLSGGSANLTTMTDSTGKYIFDSISTGYYSLAYTDSLFGSNFVSSAQFLGGSTVARQNENISKIPNFNVISLSYVDTVLNITDSVIQITGTTDIANPIATSAILYIGSSAATSSSPSSYLSFYTKTVVAASTTFKITIPLNDLYNLGFAPGQTVYFAGYGIADNFNNSSSYEDFTTGRLVFTAISVVPIMGSHVIL